MRGKDNILIIDDRPAALDSLAGELGVQCTVKHPRDLSKTHLQKARLVLIDQHLEGTDWEERVTYPLSCQPTNGLALAGIIRAHLRTDDSFEANNAVAVCLLSAKLHELVAEGDRHPREALAARTAGVNWAFDKTGPRQSGASLAEDIQQFMQAVRACAVTWPDSAPAATQKLSTVLRCPNRPWRTMAVEQLLRCRPPFDSDRVFDDKTAILTWLAQRILPYPTFLLGMDHVACRFGVVPAWLRAQLAKPRSALARVFAQAQYTGPLNTFCGKRWWAAGVSQLLNEATKGRPHETSRAREWLHNKAGTAPARAPSDAVPVLGEDLAPRGVASVAECVRVLPDDWPAFAEQAWTPILVAKASELVQSLVVRADRERL
jgi:hypothetical protein